MAAGQPKRRLNSASIVSCNLQEQYREKKKKGLESTQNVWNMEPHISLEWDDKQKTVIAKREQIGITWRDLAPFINCVPHCCTVLADVCGIPQEIFEMENVTGVLSYEVWETHLSETERNHLTQFLPKGTDSNQVVQALLMGENLHFGNSFLKWGASLCSGNLHPDAALHREHCFKDNKKAYYLELQNYHNEIVDILLKWKESWASCKDPEKDIVQKMGRKGFITGRHGNSLVVSKRPKVIARDRKEKKSRQSGDGAKYMSYFKVSRKQYELVRRIKLSSDGISSKSLQHVLGDIKGFHVQPYKTFEEEEWKKLHDRWLLVANRDVPAAFSGWRERQSQKHYWMSSLEQEMAEKKIHLMDEDEEKENHDITIEEKRGNGETDHAPAMDIQGFADDERSVPHSTQSHTVGQIPLLNGHHELDLMDMQYKECSRDILKPEGAPTNLSEFLEDLKPTEDAVDQEVPVSSAKDVWPVVRMSDSYCHPTSVSHGYTSSSELSIRQPKPIEEGVTGFIDLESVIEQDVGEVLLHRPSNNVASALHVNNDGSFLSSYANQDSNELLPPFFKGQGLLQSHSHEHNQPLLPFLATNDGVSETGQLPGNFWEQQRLLEQRQMREKELYMHQIIQKNMYSNGSRYPVPSKELFTPVHVQDWAVNNVNVSTPLQSPLTGERLLGQNWFSGEHRARGGWSGVDISSSPGQCLGNGSNADESLFSVLSQCNKLQSHPNNPMSVPEQYTPARNFMGGVIPGNDSIFSQAPHQINFLSGRETTVATAATLKENNMSWMGVPHQSSGLHDSIGKPFLRSWNQ